MKKRYITTSLALMLLSATVAFILTFFYMQQKALGIIESYNENNAQYAHIAEVKSILETRYVNDYDEKQVMEGALAGMVGYLGDPWSGYLNAEQFAKYMKSFEDSMVGIGINVVISYSENTIEVLEVYENSPAEKAGILAGDFIVQIDGEPVEEIMTDGTTDDVTEKIKGEAGTAVQLTIERPSVETVVVATYEKDIVSADTDEEVSPMSSSFAIDEELVEKLGCDVVEKTEGDKITVQLVTEQSTTETLIFTVEREEFKKVYATGKFATELGYDETEYGKIGYIKIKEFGSGTAEQIKKAINNLQSEGAKGIVFDLRNNGGGQLEELVSALDYILPEGLIIKTVNKEGHDEPYYSDKNEINLPMAVIVNAESISAAEFFAASLQEHGKAIVVGEHTIGKGCAQQIIPLESGGAINLSIEKYYTANNISLADTKGIKPDVEIELTDEQEQDFYHLGTNDPQIKAALDQVKSKIQ